MVTVRLTERRFRELLQQFDDFKKDDSKNNFTSLCFTLSATNGEIVQTEIIRSKDYGDYFTMEFPQLPRLKTPKHAAIITELP